MRGVTGAYATQGPVSVAQFVTLDVTTGAPRAAQERSRRAYQTPGSPSSTWVYASGEEVPNYASVDSSQSNAAVQNTTGAMPSQWPSAPSFWRKRRNSFGHVRALNSSSPCPVDTGSVSLSVT